MKIEGHWLGIQCFKHDGKLHRIWDRGYVLENNDNYLVIASKRAKVTESNGRKWFTKEPAITIFSKNEWWNIICMIKENGICYYCNIASPSVIDNDYIKYIDYDLDAKLFPSGEIKVLDEKEYQHHRDSYEYSEDLNAVLVFTMKDIVRRMNNKIFPFDDALVRNYYEEFLIVTKKKNNNEEDD